MSQEDIWRNQWIFRWRPKRLSADEIIAGKKRAMEFLFSQEAQKMTVGEARAEIIKRVGKEVDEILAKQFCREQIK